MAFSFKQFIVDDSHCAMKVGTDSVLLGAWADFHGANSILDIGTGCGLLALMAAQKSTAQITAIDIDNEACKQAEENFNICTWHDRLVCINMGLDEFGNHFQDSGLRQFDHIITNPPYFIDSLKSPAAERNNARHNLNFSIGSLIEWCSRLLKHSGKLSLVFPFNNLQFLLQFGKENGLYLSRQLVIIPKINKVPNRILLEFTKIPVDDIESNDLSIRDQEGNFTQAYRTLTEDFYLNLK